MPRAVAAGVTTVPIGWPEDDVDLDRAAGELCEACGAICDIGDAHGSALHLAIEPEPGCILETTPNGTDCDVTYQPLSAFCDDADPTTKDDLCDGAGTCQGTAYTCDLDQCEATSVPEGWKRTPRTAAECSWNACRHPRRRGQRPRPGLPAAGGAAWAKRRGRCAHSAARD